MIEVELRAKVKDLGALEKKVKALGGKFKYAMKNVDDYFVLKTDADNFAKGNFNAKGGVGRVRIISKPGESDQALLTIKTVKGDLAVRREIQTQVADAKEAAKILEHFSCVKVLTLTKNRRIYSLNGAGVLLDEVKELGNWVEVSIEGKNVNATQARKKVLELLHKLGFKESEIESKGYFNLAVEML